MTERNGLPEGYPQPEQQLAHLLPALWRSVYQATPSSDEMPALESQTQILRKLVAVGALSPAQLAEELRLARPTISNLVRGLVADGLVERTPSPSDGRSVLLSATARGRDVLLGFRAGRAEVLADALDDLPAVDRRRIYAALPSLDLLLERLDLRADWEWKVRQQEKSTGYERPRRAQQPGPPGRRATRTTPMTPP